MFKRILALIIASAVLQTQPSAQETKQEQKIKQEEPHRLEEIVVTAEKIDVPLSQIGSSVTVITEEDIKARNIVSTHELIRTIQGSAVTQTGGLGTISSVFLRGAASANTLVLIDGVKVNSPTTGAFDFSTIATDNIERIEVLRGPQSSLYGSEAMGGVINIITKKGKGKISGAIGAEGGSFFTNKENLNLMYGDDTVDFTLSQSHLRSGGLSAASYLKGNHERDEYSNFTTSGRFGLNFAKDARLDFSLRYIKADVELDGFDPVTFLPADDNDFRQKTNSFYSSIVIKKPLNEWWTPNLKLSIANDKLRGVDPDPADVFNRYLIKTSRKDIEFQNEIKVADFYKLIAGYEYKKDNGESNGNFKDSTFTNSLFLENRLNIEDVFYFTIGLRYDNHSTFGDKTTFRSTSAILIEDLDAKIHSSAGTGFRAPSLNELFFPGFGITTLKPEKSFGFDIGVEKFLFDKKLSIDITYFYNKFEDLIAFDITTFTANNISSSSSKGLEATIAIADIIDNLRLSANYTYNDTKDFDTDDQLPRRPRNKVSFLADYKPIEKLTISPSYLIVRGRIDSDGSRMDNYNRADLSISYIPFDNFKAFKVYGRVENLFNRRYEDVNNFSSPGISFYLGSQITF